MFEFVFYTVAPALLIAACAIPAALVISICAGYRWFLARRELKAADEE